MLETLHDSTGTNYAKRDGSADRLWLTQRTKVNPWDRRATSDEQSARSDEPAPDEGQPAAAQPAAPMISQADSLRLETGRAGAVSNPFERLIEHQLQKRPVNAAVSN
jgi:hypothetical protein